ncbi:hypothetical protein AN642_01315 [Epulopiscium sp. SCG-B10WGA-EpuloA2]|nr:hypothetical protein AN642_01315 [Epulopiscium sp. SCG-B10WGA-EpuloA2]
MQAIDLHTHSNISDGTFTPRELAFYAKAKGLYAIALTDHDTTAGIFECTRAGALVGLKVIPGIEISCVYNNIEIHILGYFIDTENIELQHVINKISNERKTRNEKMLERLNELGFNIKMQDINPKNNEKLSITRANFAAALMQKGYFTDREEIFKQYLGKDKPAYISREYIDYKDCINAIKNSGGIAVIAHPYLYKFKDVTIDKFISDLSEAGISGIETIYPEHTDLQENEYFKLCQTYNLVPTGGTDFHGDNKPNLDIGTGREKTFVSKTILDNMEKKLENCS